METDDYSSTVAFQGPPATLLPVMVRIRQRRCHQTNLKEQVPSVAFIMIGPIRSLLVLSQLISVNIMCTHEKQKMTTILL